MKTTTVTIAALLVAFGSFAQQNVEQKKSEEIKKNPALYQSQGGVIDDNMLDLPAKTKKQDYVDPNGAFIIHAKAEALEEGESQFERDWKKLQSIKDQTSYEYANEKELFLLKYPEMRPAKWDGTVEPRIPEPTNNNSK